MTMPQQPPEPEIRGPETPDTEMPPQDPAIDTPPSEFPETHEPGYEAPGMPDDPDAG
jgi:hypothetical protein